MKTDAAASGNQEANVSDTTSWPGMQFGIFSVSDITQDPTTGETPTEAERIRATLTIAKHADEVGLDEHSVGVEEVQADVADGALIGE